MPVATALPFPTVSPSAYAEGHGKENTLVLTLGGERDPATVTLDPSS